MAQGWVLALLLTLLIYQETRGEHQASCPGRCQCFTPAQVLCADSRMTTLPRNVSAQAKEVIVMTSAVSYLFTNTFQDSPHLTKLVFLNNELLSVHCRAFETLTELQELEISGNPLLEYLLPGTFSKQEKLLHLQLNFNRFTTVPPGMFDSLKQLETLQMKSNIISSLSPFLFLNLKNLQVLDVSHNNLSKVTKDTFAGLLNLQILKLNSNFLSSLTADVFHNFSQLTELHLEGNKITELKDGTFQVLTRLNVLNLRRNLLSAFSDGVFGAELSSLTELNLQDNMLTEVSPLSRLSSISDLTLSHNQLTSLPDNLLRNNTALETLDLSGNQITAVPATIFNDLFSIRTLSFNKNNLSRLEASLFRDQQFIQRLDLSENQLETLPVGFFDHFFPQHTVRLHGNPWKCDCHMWYLQEQLLNSSRTVEMLNRIQCETPPFLRKRPVVSVDRQDLMCHLSAGETDISRCSLQESNEAMTIRCKVDRCSSKTVKVQFQDETGSLTEFILKNQPAVSQCSNETTATG
ncbi:carboxypeptidase N subunit 2 [Oryzias melastigma]|uniref:Carboxypeptidase N subunit 2-like n=1 Tax=Oryzias melastigma TaxID=30732 RepID=A0A3B3DM77_ORYME|nr:carboxypeptidase N subunit 2 [Oryzias melastigma]